MITQCSNTHHYHHQKKGTSTFWSYILPLQLVSHLEGYWPFWNLPVWIICTQEYISCTCRNLNVPNIKSFRSDDFSHARQLEFASRECSVDSWQLTYNTRLGKIWDSQLHFFSFHDLLVATAHLPPIVSLTYVVASFLPHCIIVR